MTPKPVCIYGHHSKEAVADFKYLFPFPLMTP